MGKYKCTHGFTALMDFMAVRVVCIGGREVRHRRIKLSVMELFNNDKRNILQTLNVNNKQSGYEDPLRTNTKTNTTLNNKQSLTKT